MIVGGYTLDLYCDGQGKGCEQGSFFDETGAECRKAARKAGWRIDLKAKKAFCPACRAHKLRIGRTPAGQ